MVIGTLEQRSELICMDTDFLEGLHAKQLPKNAIKEEKQTEDKMPSVSEAVERFQLE